jgi:hypothetical protein
VNTALGPNWCGEAPLLHYVFSLRGNCQRVGGRRKRAGLAAYDMDRPQSLSKELGLDPQDSDVV